MNTVLGVTYYTPAEAAELLGVCERTVLKECRTRRLGHNRVGRLYRISEAHVAKFLRDTEVAPR